MIYKTILGYHIEDKEHKYALNMNIANWGIMYTKEKKYKHITSKPKNFMAPRLIKKIFTAKESRTYLG